VSVTVRQRTITCPDTRHRSSAGAVGISSAPLDVLQAGSDTRAAPTPLPRPMPCIAIVVYIDSEQRFPKLSTAICA
jgi:hypothetical protein